MQTVLLVAEMELGREVEVRAIHDEMPVEALDAGIGVERLVAFIGSGHYCLELTVADGNFQEQFHRFLGDPEIVRMFDRLRPLVHGLPGPTDATADMPMATAMLLWESGSGAGVAL